MGFRKVRSAAFLLAPLVCLALYWPGLLAWFQADDFGWLNRGYDVRSWREMPRALFEPQAQGTFRAWSERAFFVVFYNLFGLDALPFRIWVFATQILNLLLLQVIALRLTGSRAAAVLAGVFWTVNVAVSLPMTWSAVYNQVLCATFILTAFYFLLRYTKSGKARDNAAQWAAFILGFGALELNVMYPVLAAAYTWLCARRYFHTVLPMFVVSGLYAVLNRWFAPAASGVYELHVDWAMPGTLATLWGRALGTGWIDEILGMPGWASTGATLLLTGAFVGFSYERLRRGDRLPLFLLIWFLILIAPLLPLRDHQSDYYPMLGALGLAIFGGYAVAVARPRIVAVSLAFVYVASSVPVAAASNRYYAERSWRVRDVLAGVAAAVRLHPGKVILLSDVSSDVFWATMPDNAFRLVGSEQVYLAPGSERNIAAYPDIDDPGNYVMPSEAAARGISAGDALVYSAAGPRLRNITAFYNTRREQRAPKRVDAANPLLNYLFGEGWYRVSGNHRWMARRAQLRIGGPAGSGERLYLSGYVPAAHTQPDGLTLTVTMAGVRQPSVRIAPGEEQFSFDFPIPGAAQGQAAIDVLLEVSRTLRPPGETRELGLVFGLFEIR